ncbi:Di-heme cytochrome c peroxidase [Gemmatirosa kalamazoonensis]|uniref:Di-heme cytochrome c peroxidase n=1 Tax=Gemmatirosa kalamazoonensis TaxID=861299 RepID=W0RIX6_9BACT|nr:cytochrome c peroxidase [Gemmatirosa kalamazoonensis]AHG89363.1 Di-heme cytochrome c peroxidase [Gemmatirosa kalamazoonensis]
MRRPVSSPVAVVAAVVAAACTLAACAERPTEPARTRAPGAASASVASGGVMTSAENAVATAAIVRQLAASRGIVPLRRPAPVRPALVALGRALLFDPILSGNRDIACATCHLPGFSTGDGRSLSIGQGGSGFGPSRLHPAGTLIPRNAPPMFALGAMKHLFWDGRVQLGPDGRVQTPAGAQVTAEMQRTFEFGPISALGMFPVTSRAEMRAGRENEVGMVADTDLRGIWAALMRRLGAIPQYRAMFEAAYPGTRFDQMTFAHASNAIGGFIVDKLTFTNTPWDRFLAGDDRALTTAQLDGAQTFLSLKCSVCHDGATFSDDQFHNVAVAQIGPGEGNGDGGRDDFGRMNVTGLAADRYRFRTTPLRNVELTAPYGHDGAVTSLRAFVAHYSQSDLKLQSFDGASLDAGLRGSLLATASRILATRDTLLNGVVFGDDVVNKLMAYMSALTDDAARNLSSLTPERVPSGLRVPRP